MFNSIHIRIPIHVHIHIHIHIHIHTDETIHEFVSRTLGKEVADNLISAVLHGIYAGDCRKLSVRACMPILAEYEDNKGSLLRGVLSAAINKKEKAKAKQVIDQGIFILYYTMSIFGFWILDFFLIILLFYYAL